jgi:hypothetical protein
MAFLNENVAQGSSLTNPFKIGITDTDNAALNEQSEYLPWKIDPVQSYMDYECGIYCELDSGMAIHRNLPQGSYAPDSLGSQDINSGIAQAASMNGVNLTSNGLFGDFVQRMANSRYRFCLKGWARRAGYQVTIPTMVAIQTPLGAIPVVPDDEVPQKAMNVLLDNMSGIPIWFARWELWYTMIVPPTGQATPPADLADQVDAGALQEDATLTSGIQVPISVPDYNTQ